ncbi:MAG: tRNA pseudouridine(38-40) synthase TruA [Lachnospiraceae bacterium]|nr:tRNA pseudouridine(38-40) synthase TruA [Lachnospiraceae bacterium]
MPDTAAQTAQTKGKSLEKKRVLLTVAYDGTDYNGWQIQPGGRTIEGELKNALGQLLGKEAEIIGASRTDAGVHALCNKAVFDTEAKMPAEKFSYALNTYLPENIRIVSSCQVPADFHPRKIPCRKTYIYRIWNAQFPDPTKRLYSYFTYVPLDTERMRKAASYLVGTKDFAAFSTYKPEVQSTVRTVNGIEIRETGSYTKGGNGGDIESADALRSKDISGYDGISDEKGSRGKMIEIHVTGEGFLYHMVRIIAGTLMEVGKGKTEPETIEQILLSCDRNQAGPTAPACGLTLAEHRYVNKDT